MGIEFDDVVCAALTQDYGGHPYLIRHVCKTINTFISDNPYITKPIKINKTIYDQAKVIFEDQSAHKYFEMILEVLRQFYKEEFEVMCLLALGDKKGFTKKASKLTDFTNHVLGYGIVEKVRDFYCYYRRIMSIS